MSITKQKKIIPIKGMHCRSCELLIEENLRSIKGIERVSVNHNRGQAEIYYQDEQPNDAQIGEAVAKAGYAVGEDEATKLFSRDKHDYKDLGVALLFLLGLYLVLKGLGLGDMSLNTAAEALTVPLVVLIGLTAGFSTCMALVGGLVLGVSAKYVENHPTATTGQKLRPHIFFNVGRLVSFVIFGGLLGLLGSVFQLSSAALGLLTVAVGVVMLIMGLQLVEIFPWAHSLKLTLPKSLAKFFGWQSSVATYSRRGVLALGAVTFFLPCGFTQAMQVYAIGTGSFLGGAMIMGAFALGTMPGLLSIGGLTSSLKGVVARRFFKGAGLAVIAFAMFNISNGLNLVGWTNLSVAGETAVANDPNVTIEKNVQVVRMKETNRGYEPNKFTIKKDMPVKWIITAEAPYSCAASLVVPKLGIRQNLRSGENIIEFTPKEAGVIKFSCSMGMYTGVFNVVDGKGRSTVDSNVASAATEDDGSCVINQACDSEPTPTPTSGGCGCGANRGLTAPVQADALSEQQIIISDYTAMDDIKPNNFTVKVGQPVKYVIKAQEDGLGCMSGIMVQDLYPYPAELKAGQEIVMDFTPTKPGKYLITCAMNMPRGQIIVN